MATLVAGHGDRGQITSVICVMYFLVCGIQQITRFVDLHSILTRIQTIFLMFLRR